MHDVEAFGPVSTLMPYDDLDEALALAARGKGSLVGTLVTQRPGDRRAMRCRPRRPAHGRLLVLDREAAVESTGHGSPLPLLKHGGPGRAGGGEELGGLRAVKHYLQRAAVQGSPTMLTAVTGEYVRGAAGATSRDAAPVPPHFEDLQIGDSLLTHRRTVSEADIVAFGGISGDYFYMHFDEIAAKETPFGKRIAHGYFVLSAAAGLFVSPAPGPVLANYGLDTLRFVKPVGIGDTIQARLTCKRKIDRNRKDAERRRPGRGGLGRGGDQPGRRAGGELRHPDAGGEARLTSLDDLRGRLRELGAGPRHEAHVLRRWAQALPQDGGRRRLEDFLPQRLRRALPALGDELAGLARLRAAHPAADGSARLLVGLADGQSVESVLLPRAGLCVSTQVGCAVGCTFCMTGREGLQRHLGSAEIVAQVALARTLRPVRKVVFMGMGEPAHNLDAVMEAIDLLATEGDIGHKNLVLSTVGDRRVFERLPLGPVRPALALSLHSTFAAKRERLLPRAPRIDPAELVEAAERYARATHYPVQFQWTLLEGVNDGDDEIDGIARLLAGKYAVMNLIAWNAIDGMPYRRPSRERMADMVRALHRRGVLAKLRDSAGQDVEGGCGQLRARAVREVPVQWDGPPLHAAGRSPA